MKICKDTKHLVLFHQMNELDLGDLQGMLFHKKFQDPSSNFRRFISAGKQRGRESFNPFFILFSVFRCRKKEVTRSRKERGKKSSGMLNVFK